jgi:surface protein
LKTVTGIGNWDTSKVTTMYGMFNNDYSLTSLEGIGNWNTENVEIMSFLFWNCHSLPELDIGSWNTGNVKEFNSMFSGAGHNTGEMLFTHLPVENWDVSSATNMECMFYGCGNLTSMDLSKWRPGKVTNFRHTFADCFKLESIDFTGWTTESATTFDGLFNDCYSLKELDLSDLDTGNCTNFAQFFEGCGGLKTVKGMENWDVSKVDNFNEMFNYNGKNMQLEYVDLSAFNTLSLVDTYAMFNGCTKLTTVYVGDGWDMSKVTSSGAMFGSCSSLVGANGTTTKGNPTDVTYARVDTPAVMDAEGNVITEAVPGYLTYKAAPEAP